MSEVASLDKETLEPRVREYLEGTGGIAILDPASLRPPEDFYSPMVIYSLNPMPPTHQAEAIGRDLIHLAALVVRNLESAKIKPRATAHAPSEAGPEALVFLVAAGGYRITLACELVNDEAQPSLKSSASIGVADEDSTS